MSPSRLTPEQRAAILDGAGHDPCPGVEIEFKRAIGSAPGGPALHATIFRPTRPGPDPSPGLLAFHGGGYQKGDPNGCGEIAKTLALTLGITTVSASYRLATEDTPSFPGILDDALHAYRWISAHAAELHLNPRRIAVCGESAGVVLAAHLAVNHPRTDFAPGEPGPAALIVQWGCLDFVARWFDLGEKPGAERVLFGASYVQNPALYHQASPITHASAPLPPALFIFGRQDPVVHARQGHLAHAAWQAADAHSELKILPNIGHGVDGGNRPQRADYLQAAVDFLSVHL